MYWPSVIIKKDEWSENYPKALIFHIIVLEIKKAFGWNNDT
jgi:hypothetical protein